MLYLAALLAALHTLDHIICIAPACFHTTIRATMLLGCALSRMSENVLILGRARECIVKAWRELPGTMGNPACGGATCAEPAW